MLVEASRLFLTHPAEEVLEEYGFGRVREPALTYLEEHLLVCASCQARLQELDEFAALMKSAAAGFLRDSQPSRRTPAWFPVPRVPAVSLFLVAGMLLVALGAGIAWRWRSVPVAATVQLAALRGGGVVGGAGARGGGGVSSNLAPGPADRPLDLAVNAASLPAAASYRLEMVDQSGRTFWTGEAKIAGAQLSAHVPSGPRPGIYWIRLYTTNNELLREFGMRLR
jgi:hypothetical protein